MPKTTSQRMSKTDGNLNSIDGIILPVSLKEEYATRYVQSAIETLRESLSNLQELTQTNIMPASEAANIAHVLYDRTEIVGWHLMHRSEEFKKMDKKHCKQVDSIYGRMIDSVTEIHTNLARIMFKHVKYTPSELAEQTRKEYFQLHPEEYKEDAA
jgi:hypothetical protein